MDKQGRLKWFLIHAVPFTWEGRPAALSFAMDITARRQAEDSLYESELHYRTLLESSPDPIVVYDLEGAATFVNQAFQRVFGWSAKEVVGGRVPYVPAEERRLVEDGLVRFRGGERFMAFTTRRLTKDGRLLDIEMRASALLDSQGRLNGVMAILRDVSEKVAAERALRESESTLRAILWASPVGIGKLLANRIVWLNPAVKRLLGYEPHELAGLSPDDLYHEPRELRRVRRIVRAGLRAQGWAEVDTRWPRRDGGMVDINLQVRALDADRPREGLIIAFSDISERKSAEKKLLEYQERLRQLVAELGQAEERERRRLAGALHDGLTQDLALVRITLASLLGESRARKRSLRKLLPLVDHAFHTARSLTTELSPPILYELGLEAALGWLAQGLRSKYAGEMEFSSRASNPQLPEDLAVLLFRSARELIINAMKHAQATRIQVVLTRQANQVNIAVEDNGVGFEPPVGTQATAGFGLFAIRERIKSYRGGLEWVSTPGQGTRASLWAPLEAVAVDKLEAKEVGHGTQDSPGG